MISSQNHNKIITPLQFTMSSASFPAAALEAERWAHDEAGDDRGGGSRRAKRAAISWGEI
jgi:hypothetical protein